MFIFQHLCGKYIHPHMGSASPAHNTPLVLHDGGLGDKLSFNLIGTEDGFFKLSPAVVPLKGTWGWILRFSENLRFLRFFVKCILAINPSGIRDMETVVAPLEPAGPGGFFCIINIDFERM